MEHRTFVVVGFLVCVLLVVFAIWGLFTNSSVKAFLSGPYIEIVSPEDDYRHTEDLPDGQIAYIPFYLKLVTFDEGVSAKVFLDEVGPGLCNLQPNEVTDCGKLPVIEKGSHTVKVSFEYDYSKSSYQLRTYTSSFTWEPYSGWWDTLALAVAGLFGGDTPDSGYKIISFAFVVLTSVLGYLFSRKSAQVSFLSGIGGLIILTFLFAVSGSVSGRGASFFLGVITVVAVICGLIANWYSKELVRHEKTVVLPRATKSDNEDRTIGEEAMWVNEDYLPPPVVKDGNILS